MGWILPQAGRSASKTHFVEPDGSDGLWHQPAAAHVEQSAHLRMQGRQIRQAGIMQCTHTLMCCIKTQGIETLLQNCGAQENAIHMNDL